MLERMRNLRRNRNNSLLAIPVLLFFFSLLLISGTRHSPQNHFTEPYDDNELEDETWRVGEPLLEVGESIDIIMILPFISEDPMTMSRLSKNVEWILLWSTAEIHFHLVTNRESYPTVDLVMSTVNLTSNCLFSYKTYALSAVQDDLKRAAMPFTADEDSVAADFADHDTQLLLPFVLQPLDRAIYLDVYLEFRDNIVKLYNILKDMDPTQLLGAAEEQTERFKSSFQSLQAEKPEVYVAHPFGFNAQLLVMNLKRMRESRAYRDSLRVEHLVTLVQKYSFNMEFDFLGTEEYLSLMAVENPSWIHVLPCEWNVVEDGTCDTEPKVLNFRPADPTS